MIHKADKDTIIKALKCCYPDKGAAKCIHCPYVEDGLCQYKLAQHIITLIEEQDQIINLRS